MVAAKKYKGTVGVIGLGIMGGAFAKNLAAAGWRVVGYDISAARRREAARAGVEIARNAVELAAAVPTILTSLPKPQALMEHRARHRRRQAEAPGAGGNGHLRDRRQGKSRARAGQGRPCDARCPVSGTGSQARVRDLIFYASGNSGLIKRLRPMFKAFGREVYDVGAFGNGSKIKYVANLLVAINNVASAEAMVLGMKAGLPAQLIFDLITPGAGNSRVFELRVPMMVKGDYNDATMKIDVWDKDMQVIGDYARKIKVPTPMFNATKPVYIKAMKSGLGAKDTAAVCAVLEKMAKFKRKKR